MSSFCNDVEWQYSHTLLAIQEKEDITPRYAKHQPELPKCFYQQGTPAESESGPSARDTVPRDIDHSQGSCGKATLQHPIKPELILAMKQIPQENHFQSKHLKLVETTDLSDVLLNTRLQELKREKGR